MGFKNRYVVIEWRAGTRETKGVYTLYESYRLSILNMLELERQYRRCDWVYPANVSMKKALELAHEHGILGYYRLIPAGQFKKAIKQLGLEPCEEYVGRVMDDDFWGVRLKPIR